jgi:hypothetical protein
MLKLTYTENSFKLEHLNESLEKWLKRRVILALRSATSLHIEPSTASFLVPADAPQLIELEKAAAEGRLELCRCDAESLEVILQGTWIASSVNGETGIFATGLSQSSELLLQELSQSDRFCRV